VCCNHCDRDFVAQAEGGATAPSPAPLAKEAGSGVEEEAAAAAENPKDIDATTSRPLRDALAQLDLSRRRVDELQGQLDLVRLQLRREALLRQDLETIRVERDRLRARMAALRAQLDEAVPDDTPASAEVDGPRSEAPGEGPLTPSGGQVRRGSSDFQVPRYQILGLISDGAMCRIYKARQTSLDRTVAIKVLNRHSARHPEATARFQREATLAARLSHPNIVQTIDSGDVLGLPYIVMEHVEGESIEQGLARQLVFDEPSALAIVLGVAKALSHVHRRGLVHRDIKPANVILSDEGQVKLIDLGLARLTTDDAWASADAGLAVGTPDYISPEQARGQADVDIRSDIYSLGATLYRMVTGRVPYGGVTPFEALLKHLDKDVLLIPPEQINPELSPALGALIRRMMARDRDDRYRDPDELIADLQSLLGGDDPITAGPKPVTQQPFPGGDTAAAEDSLAIPASPRAGAGQVTEEEVRA